MTEDQDWISTGKAAAMLGYNVDHFREKFDGIIPTRRVGNGYRKWLRATVERLAAEACIPKAG